MCPSCRRSLRNAGLLFEPGTTSTFLSSGNPRTRRSSEIPGNKSDTSVLTLTADTIESEEHEETKADMLPKFTEMISAVALKVKPRHRTPLIKVKTLRKAVGVVPQPVIEISEPVGVQSENNPTPELTATKVSDIIDIPFSEAAGSNDTNEVSNGTNPVGEPESVDSSALDSGVGKKTFPIASKQEMAEKLAVLFEKQPHVQDRSSSTVYRHMRRLERIERDGHLFHPRPSLVHGTRNASSGYGCCCGPCRAWSAADSAERRRRKKERAQE